MPVGDLVGWLALLLSVLLGVVVVVQTLRLRQIERQFRALTRGAGPGAANMSLSDIVASQGARLDATRAEVVSLVRGVNTLERAVTRSVQCVGLVRYNPFQDTGGDQSFAIALLDKHGDGVVMSSLHTRAATRFYAKPVKAGTSHLPLSDEEMQALQQALAKRET